MDYKITMSKVSISVKSFEAMVNHIARTIEAMVDLNLRTAEARVKKLRPD